MTTRVVHMIGYTKCTQNQKIVPYFMGQNHVQYNFSQPPESYVETCTSFYVISGIRWLTCCVGYWTPTQSHRHLSASCCWTPPPPAPLPSTHHWQRVHLLVWCNLPSLASTVPIFKQRKIVNFIVSTYGRDWRPHKSIKTRSNDMKILWSDY